MEKQLIIWNDDYSVGVKVFDMHHKKLFGYINEFSKIIDQGEVNEKFDILLKRFMEYGDFHLKAEEEMFEKFNYPDKEVHSIEHNNYRKKILLFNEKFGADNEKIAQELLSFLKTWWMAHVSELDKKYSGFFNQNGLV